MIEDSIVAEVRAARKTILKRFNYDVQAMLRDVQQRQRTQGPVSYTHLDVYKRQHLI